MTNLGELEMLLYNTKMLISVRRRHTSLAGQNPCLHPQVLAELPLSAVESPL